MSGVARFRDWGEARGPLPAGSPIVSRDHEAAAVVAEAWRRGDDAPVVGLLGGDLAKTLGASGNRQRLIVGDPLWAPVDVMEVTLDGLQCVSVAHVVARRGWWRGRGWCAANAEWLGAWDLTPRSHPGDGRVEIVEAAVRWGQRRQVARRLLTGSHLPHPDIEVSAVETVEVVLRRPTPVWVDGVAKPRVVEIAVRVRPSGMIAVI